jgi:DNA-binding MarR family transcriptional regulator
MYTLREKPDRRLQMKQGPKQEELIENILELGEKAFRELFPIIPIEWLQLDLTMPQLKVILLLFLSGRARMSDIASALGVSLATATGVVDRLVERDIVLRESQPEDRRVVLCRLSEKGQKMIDTLWQLARDRTKELLQAAPAAQLQLITEALEVLLKAGEVTRGHSKNNRG